MNTPKAPTMIVVDENRVKLGACVNYPGQGWKFIPATTSRRSSRKFWKSATACLPKWAFDASEEMLTAKEFFKHQRGSVSA